MTAPKGESAITLESWALQPLNPFRNGLLATISSGLCLFLGISNPPSATKAILQGGSLFRRKAKISSEKLLLLQTNFAKINGYGYDRETVSYEHYEHHDKAHQILPIS